MVECKWAQSLSCVWLHATLWTVARQAPLSMGFSRQESWSGFPCPPSRGSSQTRDWTHVFWSLHCKRILYCWAARKDPQLSNTTKFYATTKNISMNVYLCIRFSRDVNLYLWKASGAIPVPVWKPRIRGTDGTGNWCCSSVNQREWILGLNDARPHWGGQSALIY